MSVKPVEVVKRSWKISPFSCFPVNRECSWNKTQIEKKEGKIFYLDIKNCLKAFWKFWVFNLFLTYTQLQLYIFPFTFTFRKIMICLGGSFWLIWYNWDVTNFFAIWLIQTRYLGLFYDMMVLLNRIIKGTVMKIEKAMVNDHLNVSKVSWRFYIPTIYNFAVIYP